ncbi:MAG TPA: hypothetical protein VNQ90_20465 [Chthoniobacteraceae bacterium]|nr:hypothetical protein [Chthoniobacteraceae bacterium]
MNFLPWKISEKRCLAFTVPELLLAGTVMALLLVLGFAASFKVREQASIAGCLAKLRVFGLAFQQYANDHQGYLSAGPQTGWEVRLSDYLPDPFTELSKLPPAARRRTVFICPAETDLTSSRTYAINFEFRRDLFGEAALIRQTEIQFPGQYCLLSDGYAYGYINTYSTKKLLEMSQLTRRHNGTPNFLYADGHAAPFKEAIKGTSDSNGDPFYKRLWNARYHGN